MGVEIRLQDPLTPKELDCCKNKRFAESDLKRNANPRMYRVQEGPEDHSTVHTAARDDYLRPQVQAPPDGLRAAKPRQTFSRVCKGGARPGQV